VTVPWLREHLCKFLLPCQSVWDREIVFTKHSPNLWPCEQVSWVADWAQYLSQGAKKYRLFFARTAADPTEHGSVAIAVAIHAELPGVLINRAFVL